MASQTVAPPPVAFQPSPNQVPAAFSARMASDAAPSGWPSGLGTVKKRQIRAPVSAS